jgi:hypothetical protein
MSAFQLRREKVDFLVQKNIFFLLFFLIPFDYGSWHFIPLSTLCTLSRLLHYSTTQNALLNTIALTFNNTANFF